MSRRAGFTLLELTAALALTGVALLGAQRLLSQLADGRDRLRTATIADAFRMNRQRLLRDLVANAEGGDTAGRFVGNARTARFASWCLTSSGWLERCTVSLTADARSDSGAVVTASVDALTLSLPLRGDTASFAYLEKGRGWLHAWTSSLTIPSAVGIVSDGDTLILPVGGAP